MIKMTQTRILRGKDKIRIMIEDPSTTRSDLTTRKQRVSLLKMVSRLDTKEAKRGTKMLVKMEKRKASREVIPK